MTDNLTLPKFNGKVQHQVKIMCMIPLSMQRDNYHEKKHISKNSDYHIPPSGRTAAKKIKPL